MRGAGGGESSGGGAFGNDAGGGAFGKDAGGGAFGEESGGAFGMRGCGACGNDGGGAFGATKVLERDVSKVLSSGIVCNGGGRLGTVEAAWERLQRAVKCASAMLEPGCKPRGIPGGGCAFGVVRG